MLPPPRACIASITARQPNIAESRLLFRISSKPRGSQSRNARQTNRAALLTRIDTGAPARRWVSSTSCSHSSIRVTSAMMKSACPPRPAISATVCSSGPLSAAHDDRRSGIGEPASDGGADDSATACHDCHVVLLQVVMVSQAARDGKYDVTARAPVCSVQRRPGSPRILAGPGMRGPSRRCREWAPSREPRPCASHSRCRRDMRIPAPPPSPPRAVPRSVGSSVMSWTKLRLRTISFASSCLPAGACRVSVTRETLRIGHDFSRPFNSQCTPWLVLIVSWIFNRTGKAIPSCIQFPCSPGLSSPIDSRIPSERHPLRAAR